MRKEKEDKGLREKRGFASLQEQFEAVVPRSEIQSAKEMSHVERESRAELLEKIETVLEHSDVDDILWFYGVDYLNVEKNESYYNVTLSKPAIEGLPDGYGVKGGAARICLEKSLGIDRGNTPRDVDVVRLVDEEPESGLDMKLAEKFMQQDFQDGYGVEVVDDFDEYFETRDFTINEVLVSKDKIYFTKQALTDTLRRIVRITDYEHQLFFHGPGDKMLSKALRMYVENIYKYEKAHLEVEEHKYEGRFLSLFWIAVQLDRAYESGHELAERFVLELVERKQLPEDIKSVTDASDFILGEMGEDSFYFRNAPVRLYDIEESMPDDWEYIPRTRDRKNKRIV